LSAPKVSICVAQFNRADRIEQSISSLLNQKYDSFEVIVVNDGSTDEATKVELEKLKAPSILIIHQENSGFVGAMNKAISMARGDYIAIHGAGDVSFDSRIRKQADILDQNPDIGLVSCLFDNVMFKGAISCKQSIDLNRPYEITSRALLGFENPIGHGEVMYRKSLFIAVGGYRPYFKFAQDRDLWLRMIDFTRMVVIQEVLYQRGIFKDGVTTNIEKILIQKNLAALARQCYETKNEYGRDLIDEYGDHAGLFRKGCKYLSKFHAKQSVEYLLKSDFAKARFFANLSINEGFGLYSAGALLVNYLCRYKPIHTLIKRLIIRLYPNSVKAYRS